MIEIWKDVVDFEGLYQISNKGNFRRHPDKQGKGKNPKSLKRAISINRLGYEYVDFCKKGKKSKKTVHQLVAAAFISGFVYGQNINHIDGDKKNNNLCNLEKTNYIENNLHAHRIGLVKKPGKSKYHNVSIRIDKRHKNPKYSYRASIKSNSKRIFCKEFKTEIEAAKAVDTFLDSIGDTSRQRNFPLKCPTTIPQGSRIK
jgi:hypothetical protein